MLKRSNALSQEDFLDQTDRIKFKSSTDGKDGGGFQVELTDSQYCDACHAVMDLGGQYLRSRVTNLDGYQETGRHEIEWTRKQMEDEICIKGMQIFKPHLILGCHKMIEAHHLTMWKPFLGQHDNSALLSDQAMLNHKSQFCREIKACVKDATDPVTLENSPRKRSEC